MAKSKAAQMLSALNPNPLDPSFKGKVLSRITQVTVMATICTMVYFGVGKGIDAISSNVAKPVIENHYKQKAKNDEVNNTLKTEKQAADIARKDAESAAKIAREDKIVDAKIEGGQYNTLSYYLFGNNNENNQTGADSDAIVQDAVNQIMGDTDTQTANLDPAELYDAELNRLLSIVGVENAQTARIMFRDASINISGEKTPEKYVQISNMIHAELVSPVSVIPEVGNGN